MNTIVFNIIDLRTTVKDYETMSLFLNKLKSGLFDFAVRASLIMNYYSYLYSFIIVGKEITFLSEVFIKLIRHLAIKA